MGGRCRMLDVCEKDNLLGAIVCAGGAWFDLPRLATKFPCG